MTSPNSGLFGNLLRKHRLASAFSQEELAERAGLSYRGVGDLERGTRKEPRLDTVRRLADALALNGLERENFVAAARTSSGLVSEPMVAAANIAAPSNLPASPNSFIGRDGELEALRALLGSPPNRLVTLCGPGGTGKSRLAIELGRSVLDTVSGGVFLVALAPLTEADQVVSAIRGALKLEEDSAGDLAAIVSWIGARQILLILDNFEHVIAAKSDVVHLRDQCEALTVVATSRVPLGVYGEHVFQVRPLAVLASPAAAAANDDPGSDAVRLFADRAAAGGYDLVPGDTPVVGELCARLDGLPLAIELAAARMWMMGPVEMVERLRRSPSLDLLGAAPEGGPSSHDSVRAAIDWSYRLLEPRERRLLRALSVFRGGFTVEAADSIEARDSSTQATLANLVRNSIVLSLGSGRFGLLETVREYAWDLPEPPDSAYLARAHSQYFADLCSRAASKLIGPDQEPWLDRLEAEHDNIRAALRFCLQQHEWDTGGRLAEAASRFWRMRGHLSEGRRWLSDLLDGFAGDSGLLAKLTYRAGSLAAAQSDLAQAEALQDRALTLARGVGDQKTMADALNGLGVVARIRGNAEKSTGLFLESLDLCRQIGDDWGVAACLLNVGNAAMGRTDYPEAERLFSESLEVWRTVGDQWGVAFCLACLGELALDRKDYDRAAELCAESVALREALGDRLEGAVVRGLLGLAEAERGNQARAADLLLASLVECRDLRSHEQSVGSIQNVATWLGISDEFEAAAELWGAAESLAAQAGVATDQAEQVRHATAIEAGRSRIVPADWEAAWRRGQSMDLATALDLAETVLRAGMEPATTGSPTR